MARALIITLAIVAQSTLLVSNAWAHPVSGLVIDRQGQIYLVDVLSNQVWKIDAEGNLSSFAANERGHELLLDEQGNIQSERADDDGRQFWVNLWEIRSNGDGDTERTANPGRSIGDHRVRSVSPESHITTLAIIEGEGKKAAVTGTLLRLIEAIAAAVPPIEIEGNAAALGLLLGVFAWAAFAERQRLAHRPVKE